MIFSEGNDLESALNNNEKLFNYLKTGMREQVDHNYCTDISIKEHSGIK
jgi:hypothetical protein